MQQEITTVNGVPITIEDVCNRLKVTGVFRNTIYELIADLMLDFTLTESGLMISEQDMELYCDRQRHQQNIVSNAEFDSYCRWLGVSRDEWHKYMLTQYRRDLGRSHLIDEVDIKEFSERQGKGSEYVVLSRIVVENLETSKLILNRLSNNESFSSLARQYSKEQHSAKCGGFLGRLSLDALPDTLVECISGKEPGDYVGPVSQSPFFVIYRLEDQGQNNAYDQATIRERLFKIYLDNLVQTAKL